MPFYAVAVFLNENFYQTNFVIKVSVVPYKVYSIGYMSSVYAADTNLDTLTMVLLYTYQNFVLYG